MKTTVSYSPGMWSGPTAFTGFLVPNVGLTSSVMTLLPWAGGCGEAISREIVAKLMLIVLS